MIGVLTVIAVLSAVLLPLLIGHIDRLAADQEIATLKSFRDAFQNYVLTTRVVPDQTTWYSAIAGKLGFGTNDILYKVRQESRQYPRVFLIDPSLQMGFGWAPTGLPYSQTNFVSSVLNSPMLPTNPRAMIVSSLGQRLPPMVVSGVFSTGHPEYFANLWNTPDGTVPPDGVWNGWRGNPHDVVVQRINLSPLFVHLVLRKYNSANDGYFAIDGADGTTVPSLVTSVDGYFIKGTVLTLYTNSSVNGLDTKNILMADSSFVFEQGIWRNNLLGAAVGNGVAGVEDLVQQFLNATTNVNAANPNGNAQQILVANDMLTYMSNYNVWAFTNNYDKNGGVYTFLKNFEPTMMSDIQGLYLLNAGKGNNHYPTNPFACQ